MLPSVYLDKDSVLGIRKKQIDTLKIFNDNVSEIEEGYEYKVDFASDSHMLTLHITLGPEFPLEKPLLKLSPASHHSWLNEKSEVVGAPGLINFSVHADLGRVVQATIREFQLRPPTLIADQAATSHDLRISGTATPNSSSTTAASMCSPAAQSNGISSMPTTSNSSQVPELNKLSMTALQELNVNEDCLDEFLESLPAMSELNRQLEDLMTQNEELAKYNLAKEPEMLQLRTETAEKLKVVTDLRAVHEKLFLEYQKLASKYSPQNIRENLQLEALKSDEESEKIAETFLKGKMDLETFLSKYLEQRTRSHLRKAKEERLGFQLKELEKAGF